MVRDPDAVLAELGARLEHSARSTPGLRRRRRARTVVALVALTVVVLGGTAAATKSIWAPDAPSGVRHGPTAQIGAGRVEGVMVRIDARRCGRGTVSVVLRLPEGGAATACGRPGAVRGVFFDPATGRAFAFGATADGTTGMRHGFVVRATDDVIRRAGLPDRAVYFARAMPDGCAGGSRCGG